MPKPEENSCTPHCAATPVHAPGVTAPAPAATGAGASPVSQALASDLLRITDALRQLNPEADADRLATWIADLQLPAFGGKTAHDLAASGRAQDVLDYLASFQAGFVG